MDKTTTYAEAREVLVEMKKENLIPDLLSYCTLFSKEIINEPIKEILVWYSHEKFHVSSALEPLIKNLFINQKFDDAFYLILNYPHFGVSQKIMTENMALSIKHLEYFKEEDCYSNNIDYALGILYFNIGKKDKSQNHLIKALSVCKDERRAIHINELINKMTNNV